jgi:hypothetical protein
MLALVAALVVLHGTVTIGPTMPVCRTGTPCSKPGSNVVLTFSRAGKSVSVKTDTAGRYRVRLTPGRWRVRANVGMRLLPIEILVPRVATSRRDFAIDTGIR